MMGGPMGPMPGQMGPPMGGKCDMGLLQQAIVSSRHSGFRGRGLPRGRGRGRGRGRYFRGARQGTRGDSNNQDVSTASHLSFTFHSCLSSLSTMCRMKTKMRTKTRVKKAVNQHSKER